MEYFFLNMIAAISDSRYWLGPLLVICAYVMLAREVKDVFKDMLEDME
jgi:hypothetical protein